MRFCFQRREFRLGNWRLCKKNAIMPFRPVKTRFQAWKTFESPRRQLSTAAFCHRDTRPLKKCFSWLRAKGLKNDTSWHLACERGEGGRWRGRRDDMRGRSAWSGCLSEGFKEYNSAIEGLNQRPRCGDAGRCPAQSLPEYILSSASSYLLDFLLKKQRPSSFFFFHRSMSVE